MSKIPTDTLALLTCSKCECYLSYSPVYTTSEGAPLCAKCYTPECLATRNFVYEAVAKLLLFPCKNSGCKETVPFAEQEQNITHEEECEYRETVCPLLGPTQCEWVSPLVDVLSHCTQQHEDRVLSNPFTLSHNITKASNEKYLVQAFQQLFLLEVQVNLTAGKLNYDMRIFGCTGEGYQCKFSFFMKRRNEEIEKECIMALQDCRTIPASLAFNISSLLDVLGGWDDITFTATLQQIGNLLEQCSSCKNKEAELQLSWDKSLYCNACVPQNITCKYHDCQYKDYPKKCQKHEIFYCRKIHDCYICSDTVRSTKFDDIIKHYNSNHTDVKYNDNSTWWALCTDTWKWSQINMFWNIKRQSLYSNTWCQYKLYRVCFSLRVYTTLSGGDMKNYSCQVQLTDRGSCFTQSYTPNVEYNEIFDWKIDIGLDGFVNWELLGLDVLIKIITV